MPIPNFQETEAPFIQKMTLKLNNAWAYLEQTVLALPPSEVKQHLLAHIDVAIHWKSLQDLKQMQQTLVLMTTIAHQEKDTEMVQEAIEVVRETVDATFLRIKDAEWS